MASTFVKSNRMKRMESRKSHSWWWDSHINPKNSKWLKENLEDMDQHVKRMLKLIEEDADSFAKKAEMYYQKRPELISLVEEFYRMYRSLAERYDHVTGELRKNIPSDLQSQSSGISDVGSEPPSNLPSPRTTITTRTRKAGSRQAGFDFFLGGGGNGIDVYGKEVDESSTLDSESESDDSSVNNYSGGPHGNDEEQQQGLRKRIIELEVELREVKEKLVQVQEEEISEGLFRKSGDETYEEELRAAKEENSRLTIELRKYKSVGDVEYLNGSETVVLDKIETLKEELRITREKVHESEDEVASLRLEIVNKGSTIEDMQDRLKCAQNELEKETREVLNLQERVGRYKTNLTERDQEIRGLKESLSNGNKSLSEENNKLQAEIARMSKEKNYLSDNLKELDLRCQSLEEDMRRLKAVKEEVESVLIYQIGQLKAEQVELNASIDSKHDQIDQMNNHLHQLHMEHVNLIAGAEGARKLAEELRNRIKELEIEVKRKEAVILDGAEEKREAIRQLCFSLEHYRNGYYRLREVVMSHKRTPVMAA